MAILIEQMGLAEPERSVFVLHRWDQSVWAGCQFWPSMPQFIWERNFDPVSLAPTIWVNGNPFCGAVLGPYYYPPMAYIYPLLSDPAGNDFSAVADWRRFLRPFGGFLDGSLVSAPGWSCTGITYDDAGGLRYLLSPTNVQLEALSPDVHVVGGNPGSHINLALRPGINKITFTRHPVDAASQPLAFRYRYTETCFTGEGRVRQHLERVVTQPDITFSAADLGATNTLLVPLVRSGTENWWNSASVTGSGAVGPGVIRPPVRITFNALSPLVETAEEPIPGWYPVQYDFRWGSFNESTNVAAISSVLPNADTNKMQVHLVLLQSSDGSIVANPIWQAPVRVGQGALFQTSTNLVDWQSQVVTTNRGGTIVWRHWFSMPQGFFRVVPL